MMPTGKNRRQKMPIPDVLIGRDCKKTCVRVTIWVWRATTFMKAHGVPQAFKHGLRESLKERDRHRDLFEAQHGAPGSNPPAMDSKFKTRMDEADKEIEAFLNPEQQVKFRVNIS